MDLAYAASAARNGCFDEAAAVALVSIAESLRTIAVAAQIEHGTCVDCLHPWKRHAPTSPEGCRAQTGSGKTCVCTEGRAAL